MLRNIPVLMTALTVTAFHSAYADRPDLSLSDTEVKRLAAHPTWLKLGRYKSGIGLSDRVKSDIITEAYFLSETGASDPYNELIATLEAFQEPIGDAPDESALCRFPGRVAFLKNQTTLSLPNPVDICPAYASFVDDGGVNGVSVLFIGSYLDNPGSAFGHLLLRFHNDAEATMSVDLTDVLDTAINYGAADSENDPLIPYIAKGLTGGYSSTFTTLPFFHHSERYREHELRNVWEYRLDLDQGAVDLMTGHVWELLGVENKYYFLRQNCAYRMAELVELVTESELISDQKVWVAPMDVFHAMMDEEPAIVGSVKRLASRQTLFNENYAALPEAERALVDNVLKYPDVPVEQYIAESNIQDPREALNVLLDRFAYENSADAERQREVLLARFKRAPGQRIKLEAPTPPHKGQKTSLFQTSIVHNEDLGTGLEVRVRPAYFDFLSQTVGTAPYSELAMADTRLLLRDGELYLRQLEAVKVTALNINETGAPGAPRNAWRVRLGVQDRDLACDGCLVGYVEGGLGRGFQMHENLAVYALASSQLELGGNAFSTLQAKATTGLVWSGDKYGLHFEGAYVSGIDDTSQTKFMAKSELRFHGGDNWEFRAGLAYDEAAEGSFAFSLFW